MSKWFKIGDDNFTARDISIQFAINTVNHNYGYSKIIENGPQTIDITISVDYNSYNSQYFFDLFDNPRRNQNFPTSDYKFDIYSAEFSANGCIIRSITSDPTTNLIVMDIISDYSNVKSLQDRRDDIIDIILEKKNN